MIVVGLHFFKVWPSKTTQGVCLLWQCKTPAPQVVTFADCTKSTAVCSGWFEESALLKRTWSHSLTCRAKTCLTSQATQTCPKCFVLAIWKAHHYFTLVVFLLCFRRWNARSSFFCVFTPLYKLAVKLWWKSIHSRGLLSKISQAPWWRWLKKTHKHLPAVGKLLKETCQVIQQTSRASRVSTNGTIFQILQ